VKKKRKNERKKERKNERKKKRKKERVISLINRQLAFFSKERKELKLAGILEIAFFERLRKERCGKVARESGRSV